MLTTWYLAFYVCNEIVFSSPNHCFSHYSFQPLPYSPHRISYPIMDPNNVILNSQSRDFYPELRKRQAFFCLVKEYFLIYQMFITCQTLFIHYGIHNKLLPFNRNWNCKRKNAHFSSFSVGKTQFFSTVQLCFFPMSLLYFSHRTLYFWHFYH